MHLLKKNRLILGLAILFALLFLGRFLLEKKISLFSLKSSGVKPLLETLPQDPLIRAYFNQSQASVYTEPFRQQTRLGDNLEDLIIDTIKSANSSVDVAVQELRLPDIANVLAERHKAGIKVRIILENTYNLPWSSLAENEVNQLSEQDGDRYGEAVKLIDINQDGTLSADEINKRDALVILNNAKVPLIDDTADGSKGSGLMHHKFVIVDGKKVIVTSANFTLSGTHGDLDEPESRGNANNLLIFESSQLAGLFAEEFNLMWGDGPGGLPDSKFGTKKPYRRVENVTVGNTPVFVQFAPTPRSQTWENSVNGLISKTLDNAKESIDFALFVFSDQKIVDTLETTVQSPIKLRGIIDPGFAYRNYSEMLDIMGVSAVSNCKYEAENRPWNRPLSTVGVPNLPPGDKLHHKFGIVDNEVVITGSHNWTEAANTTNDETVIVIKNPTVAAHFNREFNRLYDTATMGLPAGILAKFQQDLEACGGNLETASKSPRWSLGYKVNLNTATSEELETLPGVGPKLAQRIIETRQKQPFTSLEDLQRVSGVGPKMTEKLRDKVTW